MRLKKMTSRTSKWRKTLNKGARKVQRRITEGRTSTKMRLMRRGSRRGSWGL